MKDNKYFTPSIEDIYIGYECELRLQHPDYLKEWGFYKFGYDIPKDMVLAQRGITTLSGFEFRTQYLTKEQIEAEGWIDQNDRGMAENSGYLFKKDKFTLRYWTIHPRLNMTHEYLGTVLETNIMDKISINEFRQIFKLLNNG